MKCLKKTMLDERSTHEQMVYPHIYFPFGCHLQHGRDTDNTIAITERMSAATEMPVVMP